MFASLVRHGKHPPFDSVLIKTGYSLVNRGFAVGWDYALSWLTVLPFELTAASITIQYWNSQLNVGIFITIFLVALTIVNIFGVRGYGEGKTIPPYPRCK